MTYRRILWRKGSGGSDLSLRSDNLDSVSKLYTEDDFRQLVAAIEATPTFFGSRGELEDLASAGVFERHPLERTVRRAPANECSTRSVVRRCLQCSTGKS
jgi:hypothetical protein